MSDRKYFVLCENNCKFESMTKEQIMTAIEQAISNGEIGDVDTGFVTKIKEQNSGAGLSFWVGTQTEYNALDPKLNNCFYIITDDTTADDINRTVEAMQKSVAEIAAKTNAFNAVLWEGTAAVGETIDCNNLNKYNLFAVQVATELNPTAIETIVCYSNRTNLQGSMNSVNALYVINISLFSQAGQFKANTIDVVGSSSGTTSKGVIRKIIGIM